MAERLWAPWRLQYVQHPPEGGCFLCEAINGDPCRDRERLVLLRSEACFLIMNRFPYNNGHLMVCPCRHVAQLEDLTADEHADMTSLTIRALRALRATVSPQGFNIGLNLGSAAGAGLEEHLHRHIVPRWRGDTNYMPVVGGTKVIPQALEDLYDRLLPVLKTP